MQQAMPEALQSNFHLLTRPGWVRSPTLVAPAWTPVYTHRTVLFDGLLDGLITDPDGLYLDGTFGRGGHHGSSFTCLGPTGGLVALTRTPKAIRRGRHHHRSPFHAIEHRSFAEMRDAMAERASFMPGSRWTWASRRRRSTTPSAASASVLMVRWTCGWIPRGESAAEFVNPRHGVQWPQVIRDYGEERFALLIAKAIAARRESGSPSSPVRPSKIVAGAVKSREVGQDPATRTFQALRIHVNAELRT